VTETAAPAFHLFLPQMRMTHTAIVDRALAAEAAGFEGVAFMDHLAPPLALEHDMWEAMSVAGWVLARTSHLKVGHLVLCDAFRHPAVLARQATSLDHASSGRFELGIGWGSVSEEFTAFGVGPAEPAVRVDRLGESLEIMTRLWTGEVVDFDGEHFRLSGAQQRPVPRSAIPIVVGGSGRRTLRLVRRYATWWNLPIYALDRLDELRGDIGDAAISIQAVIGLLPHETDRDAVTELAQRRYGDSPMGRNLVIGTAAELAEHFAALNDRGVDRFYVWFVDFAPVETIERFAAVISAACS
jgi:alkanesulfonate monooxygenase SsuD/methylene tetrahydromethanopterin reductase-like flavin-dependent oxidoreductase (luciferase family)